MTSWRKMLELMCRQLGEDLIACTLTDEEMDVEFDPSDDGKETGKPFTAWTKSYVLFPSSFDGIEDVGYTYRHICDEVTNFQGC